MYHVKCVSRCESKALEALQGGILAKARLQCRLNLTRPLDHSIDCDDIGDVTCKLLCKIRSNTVTVSVKLSNAETVDCRLLNRGYNCNM